MTAPLSLPSIGYIIRGEKGRHPATAHIRVLSRIAHLPSPASATWHQVDPSVYATGGAGPRYDALLIQRDAVPAAHARALRDRARAEGTRIVVELDDDLVTAPARRRLVAQGYAADALEALAMLMGDADHVIVSTDRLLDLVAPDLGSVSVEPNLLSSQWWPRPRPSLWQPRRRGREVPRVLYMGSATHGDDLAMLEDVFGPLSVGRHRPAMVLDVVGVSKTDAAWFNRVPVPRGTSNYPDFVAWLRTHRHAWSAGVAPLTDSSFNECKSDVKFLEYTALGLATVASNRGPYLASGGHGAMLVDDDPRSWLDALDWAVRPSAERRRALARARRYVSEARMMRPGDPRAVAWQRAILGTEPGPVSR